MDEDRRRGTDIKVNAMTSGKKFKRNFKNSSSEEKGKCKNCNRSHDGRSCLARNAECYSCKKKGHFISACRFKKSEGKKSEDKKSEDKDETEVHIGAI